MQSLNALRAALTLMQLKEPLPAGVNLDTSLFSQSDLGRAIHVWEIELLAKEAVLHCRSNGQYDLAKTDGLVDAVNRLRNLENQIEKEWHDVIARDIFVELHRIAHRQFPSQMRYPKADITRYFKIYSRPDLQAVLLAQTGISVSEFFLIGLAMAGGFLDKLQVRIPEGQGLGGVTAEKIAKFVALYSKTLAEIRREIAANESIDQDFAYRFNPLLAFPLIRIDRNQDVLLLCPVPGFLLQRITEGLYYDVVRTHGFPRAFGDTYQWYVGEVLRAARRDATYDFFPESSYKVGKSRKDSVDWIVRDQSADMFIECKTKRLRHASKAQIATTESLYEDLEKLSEALTQVYKTLSDGLHGRYPHWQSNGRPIYPLVVTLEDWLIFGDRIVPAIDARVEEKLRSAGLDVALLTQYPYTVCSVSTFERAIQVAARRSIHGLMAAKVQGEERLWDLMAYVSSRFGEDLGAIEPNIFEDDFERIGGA